MGAFDRYAVAGPLCQIPKLGSNFDIDTIGQRTFAGTKNLCSFQWSAQLTWEAAKPMVLPAAILSVFTGNSLRGVAPPAPHMASRPRSSLLGWKFVTGLRWTAAGRDQLSRVQRGSTSPRGNRSGIVRYVPNILPAFADYAINNKKGEPIY